MKNELFAKTTYLTDCNFIRDANICEYDIQKANISILYSKNIIDRTLYEKLFSDDKMSREIFIGKMIKGNRDIDQEIKNGIMQAKQQLFESNRILDSEVVRIANDAVYINRLIDISNTEFDLNRNGVIVRFVMKNRFNTFLKLGSVLIFMNDIQYNFFIDVKGINDELLPLHENFLGEICNIIDLLIHCDRDTALMSFHDFYNKYVSLSLPIDFYRELNPQSSFRFKNNKYSSMFLTEEHKNVISIEYNLSLLRDLYSIIMTQ